MKRTITAAIFVLLSTSIAMAQLNRSADYMLQTDPAPILCGSEQLARSYFMGLASGHFDQTLFDQTRRPRCDIGLLALWHPIVRIYAQHDAFCQIGFPFDPDLKAGGYGWWVICSGLTKAR